MTTRGGHSLETMGGGTITFFRYWDKKIGNQRKRVKKGMWANQEKNFWLCRGEWGVGGGKGGGLGVGGSLTEGG